MVEQLTNTNYHPRSKSPEITGVGGGIGALLVFLVIGQAAMGEPSVASPASDVVVVPKGTNLLLPAKMGTDHTILGKGFSSTLTEVDDAGQVPRAYPPRLKTIRISNYKADFVRVENKFELNAYANYLLARFNMKAQSNQRYAALRVYQLGKIDELVRKGPPTGHAHVVATRVYYGWALYYVIYGSEADFTLGAAAELGKLGGGFDITLKEYNLKSQLDFAGLTQKQKGAVSIVTDLKGVQEEFKISQTPAPVFVEYTVVKDITSEAIAWSKHARIVPGKYQIYIDELKVNQKKVNGKPWDWGSTADPLVNVMLDGQLVATSHERDTITPKCTDINGKVIQVGSNSVLQIVVIDKDLSDNDPIGETLPLPLLTQGRARSAFDIAIKPGGALNRVRIRLMPVAQ